MKIAVIGGGPGGLYFSALAKQLDPEPRDHRLGAKRPRRHVRFRRRLLRRDARRDRARRPRGLRAPWRREFARWDDIDVHFRGQTITSGGHGFAAMSRKRLLQLLQRRCRRARRHRALPHRGARRRRAGRDARPRRRRRRAQLARPHRLRRRVPPRPSTLATVQVHVARHRPGLRRVQVLHPARRRTASCRSTATPTTRRAAPSSSRCTRTSGGSRASTRLRNRECTPGESDEQSIARVRRALRRRSSTATRSMANNSRWISFPHRAQRALAARAQRRAARRRRAHRALLDRLRHQARDGGRARAGRVPAASTPTSTQALRAYEDERRPSWCCDPARARRPASSGSRTSAQLRRTRTRSSSPSTA